MKPNARDRTLRMSFTRHGADMIGGYVVEASNLERRFAVILLADGTPTISLLANQYHHQLAAEGVGDAHYGFFYVLPTAMIEGTARIEAVIANSDIALPALAAPKSSPANNGVLPRGAVDPCRHLTVTGWVNGDDCAAPLVRALLDGDEIAATRAHFWRHLGLDDLRGRPVRAFALQLPSLFADGRVRTLEVVDERGVALAGSPITVFATSDGLEHRLHDLAVTPGQRLRLDQFEERFPPSVPFHQYDRWVTTLPHRGAANNARNDAAIIVIGGSPQEPRNADSLEAPIWRLPSPDKYPQFGFDSGALRRAVEEAGAVCEFFVFMRTATELGPHAIKRFRDALFQYPEAPGAYGDVEIAAVGCRRALAAWPAFDYERLLQQGYCAELFALRRKAVVDAAEAGASSLFRLALAPFDATGPEGPPLIQIPGPLAVRPDLLPATAGATMVEAAKAHLAARKIVAETELGSAGSFARVVVKRQPKSGRVAISVLATAGQERLTEFVTKMAPACRRSAAPIYLHAEADRAAEYPADVQVAFRPSLGGFPKSRSAQLNAAIRTCSADYVMLLSDALLPLNDDWLETLLSYFAETNVAAVAPMISSSGGVVLDAGLVLGGPSGALASATDRLSDEQGYLGLLQTARCVAAVSCDAILIDRARFDAAGGFDAARFPDALAAVDLCLALQEAGDRIVWTPDARFVLRSEAAIHAVSKFAEARALDLLRYRWPEALANDRYYSPLLAGDRPYEALAAAPAALDVRTAARPKRRDIPRIW